MFNVVLDFLNGSDLVSVQLPVIPETGQILFMDDVQYTVVHRDFTLNNNKDFHTSLCLSKQEHNHIAEDL
jgi:hypothetical protein